MTHSIRHLPRHALLALWIAPLGMTYAAFAADQPAAMAPMNHQHNPVSAPLLQQVHYALDRFVDFQIAKNEGWAPGTACVSGPDAGAMGVHYLLPSGVPSTLSVDTPAALIYEPTAGGGHRFVAVEYILLAKEWDDSHGGQPPVLEGNLFNLVGYPNRYGLPSFYELHVWAWENNPKGTFADWNVQVSCDKQPGDK